MKECPICHAMCFDDMDVCYGCLHDFAMGDICEEEAQLSDTTIPQVALSSNVEIPSDCTRQRIIIEFEGFKDDSSIKILQK